MPFFDYGFGFKDWLLSYFILILRLFVSSLLSSSWLEFMLFSSILMKECDWLLAMRFVKFWRRTRTTQAVSKFGEKQS